MNNEEMDKLSAKINEEFAKIFSESGFSLELDKEELLKNNINNIIPAIKALFIKKYFESIITDEVPEEISFIWQEKVKANNMESLSYKELADLMDATKKDAILYRYIKDNVTLILKIFNLNESENLVSDLTEKTLNTNGTLESLKDVVDNEINLYISDNLNKKPDEVLTFLTSLNTTRGSEINNQYKNDGLSLGTIYDYINNMNISEEEKRNLFNEKMDKVIKPYIISSIGEEFAKNQITTKYKDVLGNIETSDGLSFLNYDTVTKMKGANDKSNEVIIPESETRFFSTINAKANLYENDKFNVQMLNFEGMNEFYDYTRKNDPDFKFETILWHQFIPENLVKEISSLETKQAQIVTYNFIEFYIQKLNEYFSKNNIPLELKMSDVLKSLDASMESNLYESQQVQFNDWKKLCSGITDNLEEIIDNGEKAKESSEFEKVEDKPKTNDIKTEETPETSETFEFTEDDQNKVSQIDFSDIKTITKVPVKKLKPKNSVIEDRSASVSTVLIYVLVVIIISVLTFLITYNLIK